MDNISQKGFHDFPLDPSAFYTTGNTQCGVFACFLELLEVLIFSQVLPENKSRVLCLSKARPRDITQQVTEENVFSIALLIRQQTEKLRQKNLAARVCLRTLLSLANYIWEGVLIVDKQQTCGQCYSRDLSTKSTVTDLTLESGYLARDSQEVLQRSVISQNVQNRNIQKGVLKGIRIVI